jgi:hypothetical protein
MLGRWFRRGKPAKAHGDPVMDDAGNPAKQQGDPHELDRAGDPRGGVQSDEYRHADPRDIVEQDGVAMGGPGGTPQDGSSAEERHSEQR